MKIHSVNYFSMYTDAEREAGGLTDIAHVRLEGFTLVKNEDLVRLRSVASCIDDDPIPQHIMEVLTLCAVALKGQTTNKSKAALSALRDLLKGSFTVKRLYAICIIALVILVVVAMTR